MSEKPLGHATLRLVTVMERLLAPDGCPWDREQTVESLKPYLIEETYEVLAAIDSGDPAAHCDELGDLLLQVVFQAALRQREHAFNIDDVATAISDKLVRRHPHVFADATADTAADVETNWNAIKAQEKASAGQDTGTLAGVPLAMPALARAQKLSQRVAGVGFDWADAAGCRAKIEEELREVADAQSSGSADAVEEEIGDLLFATVSLARKLGVDAEGALRKANQKFERRFAAVEDALARRGVTPSESNLEEMDALWNSIKRS